MALRLVPVAAAALLVLSWFGAVRSQPVIVDYSSPIAVAAQKKLIDEKAAEVTASSVVPSGNAPGGCELFTQSKETCLGRKPYSSCHNGLRPCSCAWCDALSLCQDFHPCVDDLANASVAGRCPTGSLQPDPHWTCAAFKGYELARQVNLVVLSSACWWPFGILIARALYHRMRRVMPSMLAAAILWILAGVLPFVVNALLVYRNESNWSILVSGFFWWYALFLGIPLLLVFLLEVWAVLSWRLLSSANKMVVAMFALSAVGVLYLAGAQIEHHADRNEWFTRPFEPRSGGGPPPGPDDDTTSASWPLIYKVTLALVWLQLLQPLVKLRGDLVPFVSLAFLAVEGFFVAMAESHRFFTAELTWLGWAMLWPGFALLWNSFDVMRSVRIFFSRNGRPWFSTLAIEGIWGGASLLAVLVPTVMPRPEFFVEGSRYVLIVSMNMAVLVPIVLPLFDRDDPYEGDEARAREARSREEQNAALYEAAVARRKNDAEAAPARSRDGSSGGAGSSGDVKVFFPGGADGGAGSTADGEGALRQRVSENPSGEAQMDNLAVDRGSESDDDEEAAREPTEASSLLRSR